MANDQDALEKEIHRYSLFSNQIFNQGRE